MSRVAKIPQYEAFNNLKNCYGEWQQHDLDINSWRIKNRSLMLEIGAGTAKISQAFSQLKQSWQVIAIDKKSDRLYKLARQSHQDNLVFLQININYLDQYIILDDQVDLIWLPFPDPYIKTKSSKHRLTGNYYLSIYQKLLKPQGLIRFKTDNYSLFDYSHKIVKHRNDFKINKEEQQLQLNYNKYPFDVQTITDYEYKFLKFNLPIYFMEIQKV